MKFSYTADEQHSRNPFYPFDSVVYSLLEKSGGLARIKQRVRSATMADDLAFSLYVRPHLTPFAMSLVLLQSSSLIVPKTIEDIVRLISRTVKHSRTSETNQYSLEISIKNAQFLPPSFLSLARHVVDVCHNQGIAFSIELDCWDGGELPLGVWANSYQGCAIENGVDSQHSEFALTQDEMVRVYLADAVESYQTRLMATIFSTAAAVEDRQWAWLMLSRSQSVDKVIPKILAELVKPGEIDPQLLFVLNIGIGAYYYEHNYLDEASRFFEQAYAQYRDTSDPEKVHQEIRRFFWLKMGDLLSKNREYLQEPAHVFYRRALTIPQKDGELLTVQARRGLAFHLGVEAVFDQAYREIAMALDLARKMGFVQELFNCRRILGAIYQMQGKTSAAVEQLQQALDHSEWSGNPLEVAKIHNTIAYIELTAGQYSSSLNHNIQALQLLIAEFDPRYMEEINNTLSTMTELSMFSGNMIWALKLLRFNMDIAAFFSSRRSERHWNMIQSFRYMTYVYWRLGQNGQAAAYLSRYERNVRQFEHFINTFELERYTLLLKDNPSEAEIERILQPILPHVETTIHVRMMVTQFFLDIHKKTGAAQYLARAYALAEKFGLGHIIESYTTPHELDWKTLEKKTPLRLLNAYVFSDKRLKVLQSVMYRYDTVHEFSQRIINETSVADVVGFLFPIVRSQMEAETIYLYLSNEDNYVQMCENGDVKEVQSGEDAILIWAEQQLSADTSTYDRSDERPESLQRRSVMIGEMKTQSGRSGLLVVANSTIHHWIYTDEDQNVLKNLMDLFSLKMENLEFIQRLADQSKIDDLTGVYNKRILEPTLQELCSLYHRNRTPFSMIVLDGDDFKCINDTYGHLYGDKAIQQTANMIVGCIRGHDKLIRFGGDEFIVFLPQTELPAAREVAERIRRSLEDGVCTASIGVGQYSCAYESSDKFFQSVDRALYAAKTTKNKVVAVDEINDPVA